MQNLSSVEQGHERSFEEESTLITTGRSICDLEINTMNTEQNR